MSIIFNTGENDVIISNDPDKTILELAESARIYLKSDCGGTGKCGKCRCVLEKGHFRLGTGEEIVVSGKKGINTLACRTRVIGNEAVVSIPQNSISGIAGRIVEEFFLNRYHHDPPTKKYCLAFSDSASGKQRSDGKRLLDEVYRRTSLKEIAVPLEVLQTLSDLTAEGENIVTVTMGTSRDGPHMIRIEAGDTARDNFACALDIGTTTVVGILVDLLNGKIKSRASRYNAQTRISGDVVSRISYCKKREDINTLQKLIVRETVNPIIDELCSNAGIAPDRINRVAVSGNTVMMHLFLALNPSNIGKAPFTPVMRNTGVFRAKEIGIGIHGTGLVDILPAVSAYIGGDIAADMYVSKLHKGKGPAVLIDIGTNGEIVLCEKGRLSACSTAAGPAFEGYGLYHGCRASRGAVEKIAFDDGHNITYRTIGGEKATGICGTGYIDFIASGFGIGLIETSGKYNSELLKSLHLYHTVEKDGSKITACIITPENESGLDEPVLVLESDIAAILQAKAAVYAGLKTLLAIRKKGFDDIRKLILAGGFAGHLDIENAMVMGLIPDIPPERIEFIGNGSLGGAYCALVESDALDAMTALSDLPNVIELNLHKDFQSNYIDALFLPNLNENDFAAILRRRHIQGY
ncbi:MAG: DUF4445 domain-containing protein [Spirochaetales bacterium]|nr:DUF4445 domain-containing protein [Spirochaetales bacterium]